MITNVGLYGDSFATGSLLHTGEIGEGFKYHWQHIVANKLNYAITNYGVSGFSIYETYQTFLENHTKHDKNIVIITCIGRYISSVKLSQYPSMHIVSLPHLEEVSKRRILNDDDKILLSNIKGWYNVCIHEYEMRMANLMIKHMLELRPETILIRVTEDRNEIDNYPLLSIYYDQCKLLGFDGSKLGPAENQNLVAGHFTPEINELMSDYVISRITTGVWPKWEIPSNFKFQRPRQDYFTL